MLSGDGEKKKLLDQSNSAGVDIQRVNKLYWNFVFMCIAFSFNHGCVVSCLAYASSELGDELGGTGSGVLYAFYTFTSLLVARPIVAMVGPKSGLLLGACGYCVYITGFLLAIVLPQLQWPVFIFACAVGGISGGILWPSQGKYFATNAKLYSDAAMIPIEEANASFAGLFATCYLGLELVTKGLATGVFLMLPDIAYYLIFTIYTGIALLSCFAIKRLSSLGEYGEWDISFEAIQSNAYAVISQLITDKRLALMVPFQFAFGFTSSFVPYYVFGTVIGDSDNLGDAYIGVLSGIIVLVGAVAAMPASYLAKTIGKLPLMVVGGCCLFVTGGVMFFLSNKQLGTWALIVPFLVVYGFGRGTWENTNKAVIADLYINQPPGQSNGATAAFAAVAFTNGLSGTIGFFTFPWIGRNYMAAVVCVSAVCGVVSYLVSASITRREMEADQSRESLL